MKRIIVGLLATVGLAASGVALASNAGATIAPSVTNGTAISVVDNAATAVCNIDPKDHDVQVFVVYRKASDTWSNGPVHTTDVTQLAANSGPATVEVSLPGLLPETGPVPWLSPSTAYVYRCKAEVDGDGQGAYVDTNNSAFTTTADVLTSVALGTEPVNEDQFDANGNAIEGTPIDPTKRALACQVNPKAGDTKVWVVWKKSSDTWSSGPVYGDRTSDLLVQVPAADTQTGDHVFVVQDLVPGVSYDFRCKADITGESPLTSNTLSFTP